jgi:homoprotocatechuate degradation regulator HpaR
VDASAKAGQQGAGTPEQADGQLGPYAQSLPLALLTAREAVMERLRPFLREHEVTEQQWRVLRTLTAFDEIEITALAEQVVLLQSSLSRIIRDLAERGLVHRRTSKVDLRRTLIRIAPAGRDLIARAMPAATRANTEIRRRFGDDNIDRLKGLLHALARSLED